VPHVNNKCDGSRTGTGVLDFDQWNAVFENNENSTANAHAHARSGVTFVAHDGHDNDDEITEYNSDSRYSVVKNTGPTVTGDGINDNDDKNPVAHPPLGNKKMVWADIYGNDNE
jgi:hypothetical protein